MACWGHTLASRFSNFSFIWRTLSPGDISLQAQGTCSYEAAQVSARARVQSPVFGVLANCHFPCHPSSVWQPYGHAHRALGEAWDGAVTEPRTGWWGVNARARPDRLSADPVSQSETRSPFPKPRLQQQVIKPQKESLPK